MKYLDKYQQKAIKEDGNILLIAGAGSGKTYTIINKIDYLIKNNIYKEGEILAISFTNKSVNDVKCKIKYNIDVLTFHKLAINILKHYKINFEIASKDYLSYITTEFFKSLNNEILINEILNYYKCNNYKNFLSSYKFKNLIKVITTYINLFKSTNKNINDLDKSFKINKFLAKYIFIVKRIYDNELNSAQILDYNDLIVKATNVLKEKYKYKYIIIDEFQDTSFIRWMLVYKLIVLNKAKLFAVGDDYQSIYHFNGCDLNIFLNIKKFIPDIKILKLENTYRNSQELINYATAFILKNKMQLEKNIHSEIHIKKPIRIIYYLNRKKALKKIIKKLKTKYKEILILGRNNFDIDNFLTNKNILNNQIKYLTIHSAKGLESDVVILINLINNCYGIPSYIKNDPLIDYLNKKDDSYLYAEERRLFYVALTRTKSVVYLLTPIFNKSIFIKELKNIIKKSAK